MAQPLPEPTKAEIDQLRKTALQKVDTEGLICYPKDIQKVKNDDKYIRRFLKHQDNDQKLALDMVMDTLKWRQEMQVQNINLDTLPQPMIYNGSLSIHNRDKDGAKMLIFSVRMHLKGTQDMDLLRRCLIYFLERLEREEKGEKITVFFDMTNTAMKNMDMELIQYMIKLFNSYYPYFLNYIIVFDMPWLLNAMWKIIKNWLPPKSINIIKFVDKKGLAEFVSSDQSLTIWGGTDNYDYTFEPEVTTAEPTANGDIDAARKVHFADGHAPSSPIKAKPQMKRASSNDGSVYLEIDPSEELMFTSCRIGANASIILTNPSDAPVAFKIKTTSPEKYRVKPSVGVLEPGYQIDVGVTLSEQLAPASLVRDKFLVMGAIASSADLPSQEISQLFKTINKDDLFETRLRVGVSATDSSPESGMPAASATSNLPVEVISKIDQLLHRQYAVEEQLRSAKKLVYLTLIVMIVILVIVLMATNNMTSNLLMYSAALRNSPREINGEDRQEL